MEEQSLRTDDCIDEVLERYGDMVYRLAYARTQQKSDAEDVFQETFLRYIRKKPVFRCEEHRKAWLLRVTINLSKKLKASAWVRHTVPLEADTPYAQPEMSELREELWKLPQKYRTVLHLYYFEELSVQEICRLLDQKPSTVRSWLTRARALLKKRLKGAE